MKKVIALLPIKKDSLRVPSKNFMLFCGRPLYQWVLETLLSCPCIKQVVIDTDSEEFIEELHTLYPAVHTLLRPNAIRGGAVSMNEIIRHDMSHFPQCEHFLQTHTTNPLLSKETIENAVSMYFRLEQHDSLFTVNRIQARTYWPDGKPVNHTLGALQRTQDLVPIMEENSVLFLFSRNSFQRADSRIGEKPFLLESPRFESFEIDELEDVELVSLLLKHQRNN